EILRVAWPVVLEMISVNLLDLADTYFVSQAGTSQVGAMGFVSSIWGFLGSFPTLVTIGGTVAVAQAYGAKTSQAGYVAAMFWLGMALALALTAVGMLLPETLVSVLQLPEALVPLGARYLQVRSLGWVPLLLVWCATATWRARGNTRAALLVMGTVNVSNIVLDVILIPRFGLVGAAYATLGAALVGLALARPVLGEFLQAQSFTVAELTRIARIGVPAVLEALGERGAFTIFSTVILASLGTLALDGRQISLSIIGVVFLPAIGLSVAVTTLVGQRLGAGEVRIAREIGWVAAGLGVMVFTSLALAIFFLAPWLVQRFTPDPATQALATRLLRLLALVEPFDALGIVLIGALRGAGRTDLTALTLTSLGWAILVGAAWLARPYGVFVTFLVGVGGYIVVLGLVLAACWALLKLEPAPGAQRAAPTSHPLPEG
ncbi:MAG: MATE family efflux transporter, partial [Deinococcus sp.]|nr:MATE family efflux transporter [Deinococcus sp.]